MSSLEIAQAQLQKVEAAINSLLDGNRVNELTIDSGNIRRNYTYESINMDTLKALQNELLAQIGELSSDAPTFRQYGHIPLFVRKEL